MIERVVQFVREVRTEFSKITWPNRLETVVLTALVIAMIVVLTGIIFFYDLVFSQVIRYLLGARS